MTQIKSTPELANLFESIQKDGGGDQGGNAMDLSWGSGRRDAGKIVQYLIETRSS